MRFFRGEPWIDTFCADAGRTRCLLCHESFGYLTASFVCPHCKVDLREVCINVNMATVNRNHALMGIVVITFCCVSATYCVLEGLTGHWATFNAIAATLNLAAAWVNVRSCWDNWKRWRAIRPLYHRLRAEQHNRD